MQTLFIKHIVYMYVHPLHVYIGNLFRNRVSAKVSTGKAKRSSTSKLEITCRTSKLHGSRILLMLVPVLLLL